MAFLLKINAARRLSGSEGRRAARWHSADEAAEVVLQAVGAVDCGAYDDETGEYHSEPLSVEVFTAANGNRIIDAVLTCGGPTVTARYESRYVSLNKGGRYAYRNPLFQHPRLGGLPAREQRRHRA